MHPDGFSIHVGAGLIKVGDLRPDQHGLYSLKCTAHFLGALRHHGGDRPGGQADPEKASQQDMDPHCADCSIGAQQSGKYGNGIAILYICPDSSGNSPARASPVHGHDATWMDWCSVTLVVMTALTS